MVISIKMMFLKGLLFSQPSRANLSNIPKKSKSEGMRKAFSTGFTDLRRFFEKWINPKISPKNKVVTGTDHPFLKLF